MVELTSTTGVVKDLHIDFRACVALEEDMGMSFFKIMSDLGGGDLHLSTLDRLVRLIPAYAEFGWPEFVKDGYKLTDLMTVITKGMEELGFTSEEPQ